MDVSNFNYNKDTNIITGNDGSEYFPGVGYINNDCIYIFNVYLKKNGSYSIYCRKKNIVHNSKVTIASIFKKLKNLDKNQLISVDTFINGLNN